MGQILERKKKIAKTVGAGVLSLGVVAGGWGLASSISRHFSETAAQQEKIAQQKIQQQAKAEAEKHEIVDGLIKVDTALLGAQGYTVHRQLSEMGANCAGSGKTDRAGYKGKETALSYEVSKADNSGTVCISHGTAGPLVGLFAPNAQPQQARPVPQQPAQQQQPDIQTVVRTLMSNDIATLKQKGFTLDGLSAKGDEALGAACNTDGTTRNKGYHGWNTTISYNAHNDKGQRGQVCIEHNKPGQQGAPSRAQFSESLRPGH